MLSATSDLSVTPDQDFVHTALVQQRMSTQHGGGEREAVLRSALNRLGRSELRRVRVTLFNSVLRLRGDVASYHAKQLAQEALRPLAIGLRIDNQVRVISRK